MNRIAEEQYNYSHEAEELEVKEAINESKKWRHVKNITPALQKLMESDSEPREEEIQFWDVETTPFAIAKDERGYHVLFGNNRLGTWETKTDAEQDALEMTWNKVINLMGIILNKINEELKKDE